MKKMENNIPRFFLSLSPISYSLNHSLYLCVYVYMRPCLFVCHPFGVSSLSTLNLLGSDHEVWLCVHHLRNCNACELGCNPLCCVCYSLQRPLFTRTIVHTCRLAEIQLALGKAASPASVSPGWGLSDLLSAFPIRPTIRDFAAYLEERVRASSFSLGYAFSIY